MFTISVISITPAGVQTENSRDYYDVFDALTVAEIELRNALLPIGRVDVSDPRDLSCYEVEGRYGAERVLIVVKSDDGNFINLRPASSHTTLEEL